MNATLVRERAVLRHHGRSFAWAGRLLGARHAERATALYAFCRALDDLVDEDGGDFARIAMLRSDLRTGRLAHRFRAVAWLEPAVVEGFLEGLARDAGFVRMADVEDLVRYAYGVAGTVGLMMCRALDVRDPAAHPFAIDLGIGMQLTNIARDVLEDAARDRLYLPQTLVGREVTPGALVHGDPGARSGAAHAIHVLLDRADRHYRSADAGLRFLPRRARLAILTASRVYEAIGHEVRARLGDGTYWDARAFVPTGGKVRRTARAVFAQAFVPRYWNVGRRPSHDAALHCGLEGLPGAGA